MKQVIGCLAAVAALAGPGASSGTELAARCPIPNDAFADAFSRPNWNGWGAGLEQRRFQSAAMAGLSAADVSRLKLKWAFGFAGVTRAYAQPAVVGGRVFVGSASGKVYAIDAQSGCTHWEFTAQAGVRSAISVGKAPRGWTLYFGDGRANVYGIDASTGRLAWTTRVDEHVAAGITGAPLLHDGVLYVPVSSIEEAKSVDPKYPCCTFRGAVVALDAESGKVLWKRATIDEAPAPTREGSLGTQLWGPAGAAVWAAPTMDTFRRRLYVTTGNSYSDPASDGSNAFVAFDLQSKGRAWTAQMTVGDTFTMACNASPAGVANCPQVSGPDLDFGSSSMLLSWADGKRALIAGQKSGVVHAIDPDHNGQVLWQRRVGDGGKLGGIQWGMAADDRYVYAAVSDVRTQRVAATEPGAQPTPFGTSLLVDSKVGGGLVALDARTGALVWRTPHPGCNHVPGCSPAQSAAVTAIPGVVFSGGIDGHLRAYASETGRVIWDVDTQGSYQTVNGVAGQGGSIDGPGPVVVGGVVYVNSGYAIFGGKPGNVLLAFSVDGK